MSQAEPAFTKHFVPAGEQSDEYVDQAAALVGAKWLCKLYAGEHVEGSAELTVADFDGW